MTDRVGNRIAGKHVDHDGDWFPSRNPTRPAALAPDLPWSSSITSTREAGQPNPTARSTSPYCSRVDSPWSSTCWRVDWRTYTTASRSRWR